MAKADKRTPDQQKQGKALRDEGAKWLNRVEAAGKLEKQWLDDAEKAVKAFTGETASNDFTPSTLGTTYDFNILYANVETIVPAVINSPPAPDVRRRFADEDPAGKDVAEIIERSIKVQVDDSKLQVELEGEAQDAFLAGRGVVRLRFKSDIVKDVTDEIAADDASADIGAPEAGGEPEGGEDYSSPSGGTPAASQPERLANERIEFEAVSWRDFRHGPAKRWSDCPWLSFRFVVSRENEDTAFDSAMIGMQTSDQEKKARGESDNDLTGWEIWCKTSLKVYFVDDTGVILKTVDDPLGLTNFFPIATPVQPVELTGRLMPVNPFSIYSKLADELDLTTKRINIITNHMKVKGWFSGDAGDIANMLAADDTEFVPIGNADIWAANGGLAGAVAFWPVEKFILVLRELYNAREQTKQAIYEITGISDIVRGASKSNETLGAQQIKTQWGSLRIQKMQRMMERGARDLFVMMSEIIPAKFSHETLQQMTGVQIIPTQQDLTPIQPPPPPPQGAQLPPDQLQQYQQATQAAQMAEKARRAKLAQMQSVQQLLTQKLSTMYRIDVESDSTVKADLSRQKAEAAEFLQGAGAYWAAVGPMVQSGELPKEVAVEIFAANSRLFNLGKSVEDVLEKMVTDAKAKAAQPETPKPSPEQKAEADAKARAEDQAAKAADAKLKGAQAEQNMQFAREQHDMTMKEKEFDLRSKQIAAATDQNQVLAANGIVPPPIQIDPIGGEAVLKELAAQRQMFGEFMLEVTKALTAPKRIIKDQQGRPAGVETVQPQQQQGMQ
ncbi:hypothetical protein [Mesorhizobium ciceri]|uniref:Portal protein n=1 Tax=Mesorhizobium ciceri biovar biserrulae (strain HAMBI 2942 / LMG 23838 / WSM1271) TaxID=765698 RepID=E8T7U2_MESCW|nr:hypothetical protein [Mesorhizobium ciceri]ADV12943.1 hypothetical protein Mesci_3826 [Mesorhizobium ciceri biovar biserrulae WSM1271]